MLTTVLAVILGIILVTAIHPGRGDADSIHQEGGVRNLTTADTLMDLIRFVTFFLLSLKICPLLLEPQAIETRSYPRIGLRVDNSKNISYI